MFNTILEWIKSLFFSGSESANVNVQVTVNNVEPVREAEVVSTSTPTPAETIVAAVEDVKPKRKPRKKKVTPPVE